MGYIARNLNTNQVFFSKGANKIGSLVGCTGSNLTKYFSKAVNKYKDKTFNEWIISKTYEIENKSRGKNIKFLIKR